MCSGVLGRAGSALNACEDAADAFCRKESTLRPALRGSAQVASLWASLIRPGRPCMADAFKSLHRSMQTGGKHASPHALSCRAHLRSLVTSGLLVATAVQLSCLLMSSSVRATAARAAPSVCCGTGSRGIAMSQPHTEARRVTASGDCRFCGWSMLGRSKPAGSPVVTDEDWETWPQQSVCVHTGQLPSDSGCYWRHCLALLTCRAVPPGQSPEDCS